MAKSLLNLTGGCNKTEQFEKLSEGKSKEEIRELEQNLLKPNKLTPYAGEKPGMSRVEQCTLMMIFSDPKDLVLFRKHIKVSVYKGANTRDTSLIMALINMLEAGSLTWDSKTKKLILPADEG